MPPRYGLWAVGPRVKTLLLACQFDYLVEHFESLTPTSLTISLPANADTLREVVIIKLSVSRTLCTEFYTPDQ